MSPGNRLSPADATLAAGRVSMIQEGRSRKGGASSCESSSNCSPSSAISPGRSEVPIVLPEGATVAALRNAMAEKHPELRPLLPSLLGRPR